MKKMLLFFLIAGVTASCNKMELPQTDPNLNVLQRNLRAGDFASIDRTTVQAFSSRKTGQKLLRAGFKGKNRYEEFVIIALNTSGEVVDGKIVHITGEIGASAKNKNAKTFNGAIETSSLDHSEVKKSAIKEGFIMSLHTTTVSLNSVRTTAACGDCTIPEVVVTASYHSSGFDWISWISLWSLFDWYAPRAEYLPAYTDGGGYSGGGGGGSYTPPPIISPDEELAENKEKIDPKKYMDCFGNVPDANATCTITIFADIPVDGSPEILFDWSQGNPGHAFIELYKMGPNGQLVTQTIGFYPSVGFKVLDGSDAGSKVVDNANHEYNAKYTLPISVAQLQAAIGQVNAYNGNSYNMTNFNCVDFALGVFNAATAGGMTIAKQKIPGYPSPGGSSTPQGLYNRINELSGWGTPGASTNGSKAYGGSSKGPCN